MSTSRHLIAQHCVRVPGKVMLLGEYAVLFGARSLAATVDCFLDVKVTARAHGPSVIFSNLWKDPLVLRESHDSVSPREGLLASQHALFDVVEFARSSFECGPFDLVVSSDIEVEYGMGSSSALRLAVLLALASFSGKLKGIDLRDTELWTLASRALSLQQRGQGGLGSGYDIVTQMCGGLVEYQPPLPGSSSHGDRILTFEKVSLVDPTFLNDWVHIFVGGRGSPTSALTKKTLVWLEAHAKLPRLFDMTERLRRSFDSLASSGEVNFKMSQIYEDLRAFRRLFAGSPAYPEDLFRGIESCEGADCHWSFKSTGAGGEDAIMVIGKKSDIKDVEHFLARKGWRLFDSDFCSSGATLSVSSVMEGGG